jgi:hypothetical protein
LDRDADGSLAWALVELMVTGGIALGMCDRGNISDEDDTLQDIRMNAKLEDDGGNSALRLNRGVEAARTHGNCTGSAQDSRVRGGSPGWAWWRQTQHRHGTSRATGMHTIHATLERDSHTG